MNLLWILVIVLLILAIVGAPGVAIPHNYGYAPSGIVTLIVVILIVLIVTGRL